MKVFFLTAVLVAATLAEPQSTEQRILTYKQYAANQATMN